MLKKALLASAFGCMLAMTAGAADVVVRVAPPRAIVERRGVAPSREHVWTPGYHRWDGHAYAWSPGAWVVPPRPRAHWVAGHWAHRGGGWVFVEGHWR
jgi:hypothetical protein